MRNQNLIIDWRYCLKKKKYDCSIFAPVNYSEKVAYLFQANSKGHDGTASKFFVVVICLFLLRCEL